MKMSDSFKVLCYDESEQLNENRSNWTFWRTRIIHYLKGSKLWPYISGTFPKPNIAEEDKYNKWEEVDAQALSTILMNITPNVQAGLDCSSSKAAWDRLLSQYGINTNIHRWRLYNFFFNN